MLARILRYSLLVLCGLMIGVWGWSERYRESIAWRGVGSYYLDLQQGELIFGHWDHRTRDERGLNHFHGGIDQRVDYRGLAGGSRVWGIVYHPGYAVYSGSGKGVTNTLHFLLFPLWLPTLLVTLITARLWYRPIRDRLRGNHRAGFAVEMKASEDEESNG